ncbi:MAG: hypothetical protein HXX08_05435 [Chloroflexi bacterium]|uniref:TIR domain-containing protein n=1 Tax=Candidatus Chlorohelix allophototropha TaxID=3003348 RepID=A0A8T7LTF7_9CHLR|nr:hypothetical protein [Chloroflexota bacterium]WJW67179.1 hypothetical protein OZ401_000435 [Chloroflexota bacterium L227-S17]
MTATVMTVVICAPEDQPIRDELLQFFSPLIRQGDISVWPELQLFSDMAQVKKLLLEKAHQADLLVFIVSPEFLDDEFFYTELIKGLVDGGTLRIIPVILKDCLWWETPLEKLSVLPKEVNQKKGELLPDYLGRKTKRERVLCQVGLDLLVVIKEARVKKATQPPPLLAEAVTETRHLDAALPSEVEVNERVHLLAMLRTETSLGLREYLSNIEKQEAFGIKPEQVVTPGKVEIEYPKDTVGQVLPVELLVRVSSKDFELEKSEERVTLTLQKDSIPCIFPLKPLKLGTLEINLKVSSLEEAMFFETILTAECVVTAETASFTIKGANSIGVLPSITLTEEPLKKAHEEKEILEPQSARYISPATPPQFEIQREGKWKELPSLSQNPFPRPSSPPMPIRAAQKRRPVIVNTLAAMFATFLVAGFLLITVLSGSNGSPPPTSVPYITPTRTVQISPSPSNTPLVRATTTAGG